MDDFLTSAVTVVNHLQKHQYQWHFIFYNHNLIIFRISMVQKTVSMNFDVQLSWRLLRNYTLSIYANP